MSCVHGRKRGISSNAIRFKAGRGRKLAASTNNPHPRSVHASNHVRKQSVFTDRQRTQSSMKLQQQRVQIVRRQSTVAHHPRLRAGMIRNLSANTDWQKIIHVIALPCPHGRRLVSRFSFKLFRPMNTFDPAEVRKAVAEFTPLRPQKFQDLLPARDVIVELRQKSASYRSIAELLTQHCLPTSKTAIAMFCHQVLGENIRPRKRPVRRRPPAVTPSPSLIRPSETVQPGETTPAPEPSTNGDELPLARTRGPRIAQIRKLNSPPNETIDSHP